MKVTSDQLASIVVAVAAFFGLCVNAEIPARTQKHRKTSERSIFSALQVQTFRCLNDRTFVSAQLFSIFQNLSVWSLHEKYFEVKLGFDL